MKATLFHRGLLLLAGLLLSLHALVPHVHGYDQPGSVELRTETNSEGTTNLLSFLQDFFTDTDLGEDHLEHFSTDHNINLDLQVPAVLPPAVWPAIVIALRDRTSVIRRRRVFRSRHFPPSGVYPDADAPRGPPSIV